MTRAGPPCPLRAAESTSVMSSLAPQQTVHDEADNQEAVVLVPCRPAIVSFVRWRRPEMRRRRHPCQARRFHMSFSRALSPVPLVLRREREARRLAVSGRLYIFWIVPLPKFATQMLAPSKARPFGSVPAEKVPSVAPVLALSLVTVRPLKSLTQMFAPS